MQSHALNFQKMSASGLCCYKIFLLKKNMFFKCSSSVQWQFLDIAFCNSLFSDILYGGVLCLMFLIIQKTTNCCFFLEVNAALQSYRGCDSIPLIRFSEGEHKKLNKSGKGTRFLSIFLSHSLSFIRAGNISLQGKPSILDSALPI